VLSAPTCFDFCLAALKGFSAIWIQSLSYNERFPPGRRGTT
jgi:hypothetical protein